MKLNYNGPEKYEDKKYDCYKCEDRHEDKYEDRKYNDKCDYRQPCCEEHKYAKCYPMSPCPYGILFECNNGTGTEIPATTTGTGANTIQFPFVPISLGCVTIDTRCLKSPVIKFDFCSIVKYRELEGGETPAVFLKFQLSKICENNGEEIICGTWDFRAGFDTTDEQITTSFCFSHCECNSCPDCCTYFVKIIAAQNVDDDALKVWNPTLSVMAKSSC
jgi:hypothetical protein